MDIIDYYPAKSINILKTNISQIEYREGIYMFFLRQENDFNTCL